MDLKDDGTFRLDMRYFNYCAGLTMTNPAFAELFGGPPRKAETAISQREMDIAASIQKVTETVVLRLANTVQTETDEKYLCLAGGVALNCVANGRVLREGPFDRVWIQPAAGDAGGALGAAAVSWHASKNTRRPSNGADRMAGSYLGPRYGKDEILQALSSYDAVYEELRRRHDVRSTRGVARRRQYRRLVPGTNGVRSRALGGRSIIGDPRNVDMQTVMNLKIKYRESFRPFAPSVLEERVSDYFELDEPSPYMLIVASVNEALRKPLSAAEEELSGLENSRPAGQSSRPSRMSIRRPECRRSIRTPIPGIMRSSRRSNDVPVAGYW